MRALSIIAATSIALASPAMAKHETVDWTAYPEMAKDRALPMIAHSLRDTLIDPGSVTDFMMCYPPVKVKVRDGRPVRWTIMLSLNSKNRLGGYTGSQGMAAVIYADGSIRTFAIGMRLPSTSGCERVSDDEIQRLMQTE